jgi:hypothetical protein
MPIAPESLLRLPSTWGGIMNTAVARRLTLEDRVVWIGKDGYQAAGLGTITRITVHEVEVRWDGGSVTRYRRAHLHNLRHAKFISETVESDHKVHYSPESFHFQKSCAVRSPMIAQDKITIPAAGRHRQSALAHRA